MRKLIVLMSLIIMSITTQAFTSDYLENNQLKVGRNMNATFRIGLQNVDDYPNLISISVTSDSEVAQLRDAENNSKDFDVPAHTESIPVYIDIVNPGDWKIGDKFHVGYKIGNKILNNNTGMVGFGSAIEKNFDVIVVSQYRPHLVDPGEVNTTIGSKIIHRFECSDDEHDTMTYSTNFTDVSIDPMTGELEWIPTSLGTFIIPVFCSDDAETDTTNLKVNVRFNYLFLGIGIILISLLIGYVGYKFYKKSKNDRGDSTIEF